MATAMPQHTTLIARIRAALRDEPSTREVPMFGARSFMVNDRMVVAVHPDGDLLVRVDPGRSDELLARPGASPAVMGAGRTMGPGWVAVAQDVVANDLELAFWVDAALAYNGEVVNDSR
jgi:TfoX/Sxy family transcriptional regulator of competence genes